MSTKELQQIEKQLLSLDIQDLQDFVLKLSAKIWQKKQAFVKRSLEKTLENTLKDSKTGKNVRVKTKSELENYLKSLV